MGVDQDKIGKWENMNKGKKPSSAIQLNAPKPSSSNELDMYTPPLTPAPCRQWRSHSM